MSDNKSLVVYAAGGGGKSGGSKQKPTEQLDTLRSISYAKIIDLLGEGEMYGFADRDNPLKCVYFNETPVMNPDGSTNFQNVIIDSRVGTQYQSPYPNFQGVDSELGVNFELRDGAPYTRNITNTTITSLSIRLSVPSLSRIDANNGSVVGYRIDYKIELSVDGSPFVEQVVTAMSGKTTTKYERTHRIELPPFDTNVSFRVTRITANANSAAINDTMFVESYTETVDLKLRMPMSASVAVEIEAQQFPNIPSRAYDWKGLLVKIPTNYDPETRVYSGIWDGTFQVQYSDNPAWHFYDMVLNDRYGLGDRVTDAMVDKWNLYRIAQYCDELVPDGYGGFEPRFRSNLFLQEAEDAYKVMQDMATVFRGILYAASAQIVASADMPEDAGYIFNQTNVIDGEFTYSGSGASARHTVAYVSWSDLSDFGRAKVEYVDDPEMIARFGVQAVEVTAMGCFSRGQARRMGQHILATERYATEMVAFGVGLDGDYFPSPGRVIRVADPLRAGKRMGGRVMMATLASITVDINDSVEIGDIVTCVLPDGQLESRAVSTINEKTFGFSEAFTQVPQEFAVWIVETDDLRAQQFRVLSVVDGNSPNTFSVTALKYTPGIYDLIEQGIRFEEPLISSLTRDLAAVTDITITARDVADENTTGKVVAIAWVGVSGATAYQLRYRVSLGEWVEAGDVYGTYYEIKNALPGDYEVEVIAFNMLAKSAAAMWGGAVTPVTTAPGFVSTLNANILEALTAAENAQAAADGIIVSFYQSTPPVIGTGAGEAKDGDIWYNEADNNRIHRVVSGAWLDISDDRLGIALLAASTAQATADGKINTYFTFTAPTAEADGDLWFNRTLGKLFRWNGTTWGDNIGDVTLDQLGGSGVNLLPDQYSTFEAATIPSFAYNSASGSRVAGPISGGQLRLTVSGATASFDPTSSAANFPIDRTKQYIFSVYITSSIAIAAADITFVLQGSPSNNYITSNAGSNAIPANTRTRTNVSIDASAFTAGDTSAQVMFQFPASVNGQTIDIDGIMVEEAIGRLNRPSTYTRGTSSSQAISALIAAQAAQATADGVIDIWPKGGSPPSGAKVGDYWQDATGKWWISNGSIWIDSTDSRLPQVVLDTAAANAAANTAQATANSKTKMFALPSTTPPTGQNTNDQWYQTDTKTTYYWNGSGWSLLADQTLSLAQTDNAIVNPNFDAGRAGWEGWANNPTDSTAAGWNLMSANGVGAGPRAVVFGPVADGTRLMNRERGRFKIDKSPCRVMIAAYVNRNLVAADGRFFMELLFEDAALGWIGNSSAEVFASEVNASYTMIRRYIDVPAGVTHITCSFWTLGLGAGGAWGVDSVYMRVLKSSADVTLGLGVNLVPNSDFGGLGGDLEPWTLLGVYGDNIPNVGNNSRSTITGNLMYSRSGRLIFQSSATTSYDNNHYYDVSSALIPIEPNTRYEASVDFAVYRCNARFYVRWETYTNSVIGYMDDGNSVNNNQGGELPASGTRVTKFGTSPSNAAFARLVLRKGDTYVSLGDSYLFAERPYFGKAGANQTEASPYSAGPVYSVDGISNGANYGKVANDDLVDDPALGGKRRIGLRKLGSRQTVAGQRNLPANMVNGFGAVNNTTPLTANSSGQVSINAFTTYLNGETVSYSAVTNAVVGLSVGSTYVIYCIDPYQDGGTRTWYAAPDVLTAQSQVQGVVVAGAIKIPASGSSGGGSSGGGNPGGYCVSVNSYVLRWFKDEWVVTRAGDIEVGDYIMLRNGKQGFVSHSKRELQDCVRFEAKSGASLTCSRTAPIGLVGASGQVLAPYLMGHHVDVLYPVPQVCDTITTVINIGSELVQCITCEDDFFWASDDGEHFFAHHNYKYDPP